MDFNSLVTDRNRAFDKNLEGVALRPTILSFPSFLQRSPVSLRKICHLGTD